MPHAAAHGQWADGFRPHLTLAEDGIRRPYLVTLEQVTAFPRLSYLMRPAVSPSLRQCAAIRKCLRCDLLSDETLSA
jgi:hypothetical protein